MAKIVFCTGPGGKICRRGNKLCPASFKGALMGPVLMDLGFIITCNNIMNPDNKNILNGSGEYISKGDERGRR